MNSLTKMNKKREGGFTLLELLIVISIIAILSIALVFMLNPAETLKKARDAQRISDLKSVKTALGIMLTSTSTPSLDGTFGSTLTGICTSTGAGGAPTLSKIAYSSASAPTSGINTVPGTDAISGAAFSATSGYTSATAGKVDGNGWIPVNLKALTGGTPISNFPIDPTNTISAAASINDLVYRYACQNGSTVASKPAFIFEIDAQLESNAYTSDDDKRSKDGGDYASIYETGNSLNLLPSSAQF